MTKNLTLLALALALLCSIASAAVETGYERVPVTVFSMSQCPDCEAFAKQFQETVMEAEGLPQIITLSEEAVLKDDGSGGFTCLHGPDECVGDALQLCSHNLTTGYQWWNMTLCMYLDRSGIPANFQRCASSAGFTETVIGKISDCAKGDLGHALMEHSVEMDVQCHIKWAPTIFVGGKQAPVDHPNYLKMICDAYSGPAPAGCH